MQGNMKKLILVLTVFALQKWVTAIDNRTPQEVLEDFEPVFYQLLGQLSGIISGTHTIEHQILWNHQQAAGLNRNNVTWTVKYKIEEIEKQVNIIINETGMLGHENLIKKCIDVKNSSIIHIPDYAEGGYRVCSSLPNTSAQLDLFSELYPKQVNLFHAIENVKPTCLAKSSIAFEMQTCLIEELYLKYRPALQNISEETRKVVTDVSKINNQISINRNICVDVINQNTEYQKRRIIDTFALCCKNAANKQ